MVLVALVVLVVLVLAAAGRMGTEVLIKVQESVLLKFILIVPLLVQFQLQNCQNQTFMSLKEQFQMIFPACAALSSTRHSQNILFARNFHLLCLHSCLSG